MGGITHFSSLFTPIMLAKLTMDISVKLGEHFVLSREQLVSNEGRLVIQNQGGKEKPPARVLASE